MKLLPYAFFVLLSQASFLHGHEITFKDILIKHPIIPVFGGHMKTVAGYMSITNSSNVQERIMGVKANFATAMIHKSSEDTDGVVRMEHIKEVIIPANSTINFEQGGLHIMFVNLEEKLEPFVDQEVTLIFEKAGELSLTFMVEEANNGSKMDMDHNKDH